MILLKLAAVATVVTGALVLASAAPTSPLATRDAGAAVAVPRPPVVACRAHGTPRHTHCLRAPVPVSDLAAIYRGVPVTRQGWRTIGDTWIDGRDWRGLARCESGGDPRAYLADDPDSGGPRYGMFQFALESWAWAWDGRAPYARDPRAAPWWVQVYAAQRFYLKALVQGPNGDYARYPPYLNNQACGPFIGDERGRLPEG